MDDQKFRCSKHTTKVWGTAAKPYTVSCADGIPTCTCTWYAVQRNKIKSRKPGVGNDAVAWCKHIEGQLKIGTEPGSNEGICNWRGVPFLSLGVCPQCGSRLEPIERKDDGQE